jgi:hypothetical protein
VKKVLATTWFCLGVYFVISSLGKGSGVSAAIAMVCGFMVARNMADIIDD